MGEVDSLYGRPTTRVKVVQMVTDVELILYAPWGQHVLLRFGGEYV